jgi:hypothetical protein
MSVKDSVESAIEPTAEVIDGMVNELEVRANELRRCASQMRENRDLGYALDAIGVIKTLNANIRTDLLLARPFRFLGIR